MDWESIKRNFRFRSGRASRSEKRYPSHPPTRTYEPYSNPPSHTLAPSQPAARNGARLVPSPSKPSTSVVDQNNKPKRVDPATHNHTTRPAEPQRLQTQGTDMERQNGTAAQPKQPKRNRPQAERTKTDPSLHAQSTDDMDDFDLRPQPRKKKSTSLDVLSESLFSGGHLETILHDPQLFARFTAFLDRYRPQVSPILARYLEIQKAIKAIEYANAVAKSVAPLPSDGSSQKDITAAHIDASFGEMRQNAFEQLLSEALPAYVTYSLIKVATEIMVNEITGRSTPIMKGLVSGLSEVFCLTDPNQEDNPIIYASDEFYHMTGYARDFVIGTNCRFLQGPKTKRHSVQRLRQAVDSGQELSEALLNYRRDGRPFMNILMIAPLHDNKGNVKYHIGAQVDASGLVEGGKGLDGFERYLAKEQAKSSSRGRSSGKDLMSVEEKLSTKEAKRKALEKLGELSDMFDLEENAIVAQRSRSSSRERRSEDEESIGSGRSRRVFAESTESSSEDEGSGENERTAWALSQTGSSGKLPGIYQSYCLVRPSPSLKIIFASPALRKMGKLVQSRFLSHITAPPTTLKGLKESFEAGNPVTAKVLFSAQASESKNGRELDRGQGKKDIEEASSSKIGRKFWISATPLFGGDDEVGVWMVVLVDQRPLSSGGSYMSSNRKSQRTPSSNINGDRQSVSSSKSPPSNLASTSTPKAIRPSHIDIPDRVESRQEDTQQTNGLNRSTAGQGSPQQRKSSAISRYTEGDHDVMISRDDQLDHKQHPDSSSLPTPHQQQNESSASDKSERQHEPRDMYIKSDMANIQLDANNGDEDFKSANETEADHGFGHKKELEGHEKLPMQNGSVPGVEADTMKKNESNVLAPAEPKKISDRIDGTRVSPEVQDPTALKGSESFSKVESGKISAPAPVPQPLSEQALEMHNREVPAKEKPAPLWEEPQAQSAEEPNISPWNQVQKEPETDLDLQTLKEVGSEEGEFNPTNVKDDQEPAGGENGDGTITAIDQYDDINGVLESSHSTSGPTGSKTASGYMDYLRHPGSRPGSRRGITATNLGSQGYKIGEIDQKTWAKHEDPDCDMRSPFSVD